MPSILARPCRRGPLLLLAIFLIGAPAQAHAQSGRGHTGRQKTQQPTQQPSQSGTPSAPEAKPGPRLEAGAIFCQSRDDLVRYQAAVSEGASPKGEGGPPQCRRLEKPVGVQILDRDGPSRTQIATTDEPKLTGWTNAYLP